ncbi:MAG TPA: nitroreductase [Beijerinckiaceae bacterium]|jgi:nitroreductase
MKDQVEPQASMIDLLARRRSAPPLTMTGPGPDAAELDRLLTVAARTPDHGKLAPWRFIVFEGEARARAGEVFARVFKARHPEASDAQLDVERRRFQLAPLVVGVVSTAAPHPKIPEWEQTLSAGAVCMNLTAAALALGYVSAWLTQWVAYDAEVLAALGVAPHEKVAGFVHIGRATTAVEDRPRPALADVVTRF